MEILEFLLNDDQIFTTITLAVLIALFIGNIVTDKLKKYEDVDANGVAIENNYDHLLTRFGVIVSGMQTISGTQSVWKGGDTPDGTPEQFTLALNGIGSPDNLIGRIMPSDAGLFDLSVHATGRGDTSTTQSGIYTATLTAVITAEEQL